jgi:hypothetical protein
MEPQQVLGVTKEDLDSCQVLLLVDSQDLVHVKEDLVVVLELTKIILAVALAVVIQEVQRQITVRILKAVAVVPTTTELTK